MACGAGVFLKKMMEHLLKQVQQRMVSICGCLVTLNINEYQYYG